MQKDIVTYTAKQVAEILHLTHRGVLSLIKQKRIKAVRIGRRWIIKEDEIKRIMEEGV